MRSINETVEVACSAERLFQTLHTPSEICMWWNARSAIVVPQTDGLWAAAWGKDEDQPECVTIARLKTFDPPRLMVMGEFEYVARGGKPLEFVSQLTTTFRVESVGECARLSVTQAGFPDDASADDFFRGCCQGWTATLAAIKDYF